MKAALQAAGGRLLYAVKCFWPTLSSFPISADKTGADLADGCDKIKPPPRRMNAGAHAFFFSISGAVYQDKQQHSWNILSLGVHWFIFLFFKSAIHYTLYEILAGISIIKACYEGVEHVFFTWIMWKNWGLHFFFLFFSSVMCYKEWPGSWETPEIYIILHHADFTFLFVSRESMDQRDASCRSIARSASFSASQDFEMLTYARRIWLWRWLCR